jgi:hypothetical protein
MKTVHVITHCYAAKIPDFAKMLTAQISSLILWPPKTCRAILQVCTTPDDVVTAKAIIDLANIMPPLTKLDLLLMPKTDLFRRAIGRNAAAKASMADVCWFADADYLFGEGCLDAVAAVKFPAGGPEFALPRDAAIHADHNAGDAELARIEIGKLFEPDLSKFKRWAPKLPIGGLQIVSGDTARQGYLDGTKWIKPLADASLGFQNTSEDSRYRKSRYGGGSRFFADIPGVFRMRHWESAFETREQRAGKRTNGQTAAGTSD